MIETNTQERIFEAIAGIDGKITDLDGRIAGIDGKITDLDGRIAGIDGKITGLESKVELLATDVRENREASVVLQGAVGTLQKSFDILEETVEDSAFAVNQSFNRVEDRFNTLDENVEVIKHQAFSNGDAVARLTLKFDNENAATFLHIGRIEERLDRVEARR